MSLSNSMLLVQDPRTNFTKSSDCIQIQWVLIVYYLYKMCQSLFLSKFGGIVLGYSLAHRENGVTQKDVGKYMRVKILNPSSVLNC